MTFDQVQAELLKLEARSKGAMKLDIAGYTIEDRPLYIAKIGRGPERMWIQGRIHGNEPLGNDVGIEIIKSLLSRDKKLLDKMTFWVIPILQSRRQRAFLALERNRQCDGIEGSGGPEPQLVESGPGAGLFAAGIEGVLLGVGRVQAALCD